MEPMVVRPSTKLVWVWYVFALLVVLAGVFAFNTVAWFEDKPPWLMLIPLIVFWIPVQKHIATRLVCMTLTADRLTLERGLMSKYTRTIDMSKVQDVSVRQSVWGRLFGIGDVSLETAGEGGQMAMPGIDRPRDVAHFILESSKRPAGPGSTHGL